MFNSHFHEYHLTKTNKPKHLSPRQSCLFNFIKISTINNKPIDGRCGVAASSRGLPSLHLVFHQASEQVLSSRYEHV